MARPQEAFDFDVGKNKLGLQSPQPKGRAYGSPFETHPGSVEGDSDRRENNSPVSKQTGSTLNAQQTANRPQRSPVLVAFNRENFDSDYVLLQDVVDKLKLNSKFDTPEIVVLGLQSEGKSTMLEALAKVKLPKGDGMCTKCLIRLCIRNKPEEENISISLNGFSDISGIQSDELQFKLSDLMSKAVQSSGVSMETVINVNVSGPSRVNLTVTDVPGFTEEIKEDKSNMQAVESLISKPNVIMVVVLKAVNDLEASIGHTLARKFDPESKRTMWALTHCDNLAENKQPMVRNMIVNRGAFAVHCFSGTGQYSSAEEKKLFSELFWSEFPQSNLGIDALAQKLAQTMYAMIAPHKDLIRERLRRQFLSEESEYIILMDKKENLKRRTKKLLHETAKEIEAQLAGLHSEEKNELFSACRKLWTETLDTQLVKIGQDIWGTLETIVADEYENQRGSEFATLVHTFPVLKRIINRFMTRFEPVMIQLVDEIEVMVLEAIQKMVEKALKDHQHLLKFVSASIATYSLEFKADVTEKIKSVLEMEKVVYCRERQTRETQSPSSHEKPYQGNDLLDLSKMSHEENHKRTLLEESKTYLELTQDRIAVTIPKAIVQFLLKRLVDDIFGCITQKISPDVREKMHQAITAKAEMLSKSLDEIKTLLNRF